MQPIQLLWVNLIMDSLGSLAEATDPPSIKLLDRQPQGRDEYIVSQKMMKHLLIMGIFQWIVIFVIIFAGEYFVPEDNSYFPNTYGKFVYPGRAYNWKGDKLYLHFKEDLDKGPSRHFTVVFNVFVFMQIFNMICARKIDDEINIFEGIHHNLIFYIYPNIINYIKFKINYFLSF